MHPAIAGMKLAYLDNLSTTTIIVPYPSDSGKQVMKSKVSSPMNVPLSVMAPRVLLVVVAPLSLVGTQDKSAHNAQYLPTYVANNR